MTWIRFSYSHLGIANLFLGLTLLVSCGGEDAILSRAKDLEAESAKAADGGSPAPGQPPAVGRPDEPSPPGAAAPPPVTGEKPLPGRADEPAPGNPAIPPPGGALGSPNVPPPGGSIGVPTQPPPGGAQGNPADGPAMAADTPTVAIKGTVAVKDWAGGPIRIDIFDGDQRQIGGKRPSVVGMARLEKPGPYEVKVPASTPRVWVGAFADENKDGRPGPTDPAIWYPKNPVATDEPNTKVDLNLVKDDRPAPGKTELQ